MGIKHDRCGITSSCHRLLLWLLLACLGLVGVQVANATTWRDGGGWNAAPITQGADGVYSVLPDMASPNNTHTTTCTPSSCNRTGDLPAPRGRGNPRLSPTATFPKAAVAAGAIALGSRALPWLSVGMGIYDWFNQAGLTVNPDGDIGEMAGAQETVSGYSFYANGSSVSLTWGQFASSSDASAVIVAKTREAWGSNFEQTYSQLPAYNVNGGCGLGKGCFCNKNLTTGAVQCGYGTAWKVERQALSQTACALVSTGQIQGNATGGLCPNGAFQPVSDADAAARLNNANITADVLRRALEEVLKAGGSIEDTGNHSVLGPSSVPGETTTRTSTSATGATQVTTVTNNYNYNYNGNTVTITTTEITQNPDGSTEETTSNQIDLDQCEKNPTSAACVQLGQPPSGELPETTKTVSFTPVSFSANQSCPGPVQFNALGRQLEFSYAPMCETISTWVRALVLAACAFIAAFVFIGGLKA